MVEEPEDGEEFERRRNAYHEAGHASMFWFFGQQGFLSEVRLEEVGGVAFGYPAVYPGEIATSRNESWAQEKARMFVMHALAGPCADLRCAHEVSGGDLAAWHQWVKEEFESLDPVDWSLTAPFAEDDMPSAVGMAQELDPEWDGTAIPDFLRECAEWTYEAVTEERMWNVIENLASVVESQSQVSGDAAWKIMEQAWGNDSVPPVHQSPWKERFSNWLARS